MILNYDNDNLLIYRNPDQADRVNRVRVISTDEPNKHAVLDIDGIIVRAFLDSDMIEFLKGFAEDGEKLNVLAGHSFQVSLFYPVKEQTAVFDK